MLKIAKSLLISSALLMMVSMSVGCATLPASLASFRSPMGNSVPPQSEPEIESGENKFNDEIMSSEK